MGGGEGQVPPWRREDSCGKILYIFVMISYSVAIIIKAIGTSPLTKMYNRGYLRIVHVHFGREINVHKGGGGLKITTNPLSYIIFDHHPPNVDY